MTKKDNKPDPSAAQKARAAALREEIGKIARGKPGDPSRPPTPREITDAAARREWERLRTGKK